MLCDGLNATKLTTSTTTTLRLLAITRESTLMIILRIILKTKNDAMQDVHGCSMGTFLRVE